MKTLHTGAANPQWESNLVKDLYFIKKHLRYPFSRKTLAPALMFGLLMAGISRMCVVILWATHIRQHTVSNVLITVALIVACIGICVFRYMQLLRFVTVHTSFTAAENQELMQRFLVGQNLAFSRHPEAPEVFQIISRNISPSKREQREVMIFIADNKRVLLNSHFTNRGFALTPDSGHYRQMANRLHQWVKIHHTDKNTTMTPVTAF
jgi:hypothetical protein